MSLTPLLEALQEIEAEASNRAGSLSRIKALAAEALAAQPYTTEKAPTISHDGDVWTVLSTGATLDDTTYCHLASTTRGHRQSNGWRPVQIADWIDNDKLYLPIECSRQTAPVSQPRPGAH